MKINTNLTKTRQKRKGAVTATHQRLKYRDAFWNPLKQMLLEHFKIHGAKRRMSATTGIADSQLHVYTCPECEHDVEPCFSIGISLMLYLIAYNLKNNSIDQSNIIPGIFKLYSTPPKLMKSKTLFFWQKTPSVNGGHFYMHAMKKIVVSLDKKSKRWTILKPNQSKPISITFSNEKMAMKFADTIPVKST